MKSKPQHLERKRRIIVGMSDARVSDCATELLVTYSLGSCIGVALYDPLVRLAGLLHYQLPSSVQDPARALERPLMYADTGMEQLLGQMEKHGAQRRRMKVILAGAARMLNDTQLFNIGSRNHAAIRKFLWQHDMLIEAEEIGGSEPRTMYLRVLDGTVFLKTKQGLRQL